MQHPIFNVSLKKRGGIRFLKLGRINIAFSVSRPKPDVSALVPADAGALRYARLVDQLERDIAAVVAHNLTTTFH